MNLPRSQEDLSSKIRKHGREASESRQVTRRLEDLLPTRLRILQQSLPLYQEKLGRQKALLQALCHVDYRAYIEELIRTSGEARRSRVEYETHLMMLEAQRTLRQLRTPRSRS